MNDKKKLILCISIILLSLLLFIKFKDREFGVTYAKIVDSNGGVHTFRKTPQHKPYGFSIYVSGNDAIVYHWNTLKNNEFSRKYKFYNCAVIEIAK